MHQRAFWMAEPGVKRRDARAFLAAATLAGLFALVATACSDSDSSPGSGPTPDGGPTAALATCQQTADCTGGDQVCHPFALTCATPGPSCTAQTDCTGGSYCEPSVGACLVGTVGSPCAGDGNCDATCLNGTCGCQGLTQRQNLTGSPLDIYFIFDRTGSMGDPCPNTYQPNAIPPLNTKACFATYATLDFVTQYTPPTETRLAFQFMAVGPSSSASVCNGTDYAQPAVPFRTLPVPLTDPLATTLSREPFELRFGTHIQAAVTGIAGFTSQNRTAGREIIGVLMTDGQPDRCEPYSQAATRQVVANHLATTGIRTFIIGMQGANEVALNEIARAGGAEPHNDFCGGITPPCYFWSVGDGAGNALASALESIARAAAPLPCEFPVSGLSAPAQQTLDFSKVNVTLTDGMTTTTIGQVPSMAECPTDRPAWYYDSPNQPTKVQLCPVACQAVSGAADGAQVDVAVGCQDTVILI